MISYRCLFAVLVLLGTTLGATAQATVVAVQGVGPKETTSLYSDAFFAYQYVQPNVSMSYTPMNSASAICRLESYDLMCNSDDTTAPYAVDFAGSVVPLQPSDYAAYPDLQMYPMAAVAVVPIYNLPGAMQPLTLTRQTLARIYTREIQTWDDPRIVATNPNFTAWGVPKKQPIQIVALANSDGITFVYKSALAAFYPAFASLVPVDTTSKWGPFNVTLQQTYQQLNAYVATTPYTIGYCTLGQAAEFYLPTVALGRSSSVTYVTSATVSSLTYTILELGPTFGNNNDSSRHLTASLWNSQGLNAWPIATYTYVVLRKNTLREGATCDTRQAMVDFLQWFWTASMVSDFASANYMVTLPDIVQEQVLTQFLSDVRCNGTTVWQAPVLAQVSAYGKLSTQAILTQLGQVYGLNYPAVNLSYTSSKRLTSTADVAAALVTNTLVAFSYPSPKPVHGGTQVLFAGVAFAVISLYNLVLDIPTLAAILDGTITTWLHPNILALNPSGLVDMNGNMITDRNQRIILFCGTIGKSSSWVALMQAFVPSYTGAALNQSKQFPDEQSVRSSVAGTLYSLAVTNLITDLGTDVRAASIQRTDGNTVTLTWQSVQACASADVYDPTTNSFNLVQSQATGCYPFCEAIYLAAMKSTCDFENDPNRSYTISFLQWLFSGSSTAAALQEQNFAPLLALPQVQRANQAALEAVACNKTEVAVPLGPILGGSIGAVCLVAVGAGVYAYYSTKQLRQMKKRISDDNVAEECAQAIAGFNLDAVAWLADLPKPSRIQKSFLQIVGLLTEVKPYIPDHLLATLQKANTPEPTPEPVSHGAGRGRKGGSDTRSSTPLSTVSSESGPAKEVSKSHSEGYTSSTDSSKDTRGKRSNPKLYKPRVKNIGEFSRRTCTYLFVKYSIVDDSMAESARVSLISTLAAHVITTAKTRFATIDHVAFDSVALHWNVTQNTATAPTHAVALALELANMKTILPPERQESLRLAIGIGHGMCSITTVSAAGHRFFVVGGPAVSTAVDLVMLGCPAKVQCNVLMTESVQREVCYSNHALPRMLFEGILLYEPIRARANNEGMDEWMYELQNMDAGEASAFDRQLQEVFGLAREGAAPAVIRQKVRALRADHPDRLTVRDQAGLDLLQSALENNDVDRVS